ncbi:MAG: DNA-binding protein [Clostridia bacterium]|nr:DNA-binding protein [Clostridia bacterium]
MEYRKFDSKYVVRLNRGEEVVASLLKFAEEEKVVLANISGIGAGDFVKFGLFDVKEKQYHSNELKVPFEIASLMGTFSEMNGKPYLHLHISVGVEDGHIFGGHLNECKISATCEIVVDVIEGKVGRKVSEEVGLNLFDF